MTWSQLTLLRLITPKTEQGTSLKLLQPLERLPQNFNQASRDVEGLLLMEPCLLPLSGFPCTMSCTFVSFGQNFWPCPKLSPAKTEIVGLSSGRGNPTLTLSLRWAEPSPWLTSWARATCEQGILSALPC